MRTRARGRLPVQLLFNEVKRAGQQQQQQQSKKHTKKKSGWPRPE
jgi:hypothetical protein